MKIPGGLFGLALGIGFTLGAVVLFDMFGSKTIAANNQIVQTQSVQCQDLAVWLKENPGKEVVAAVKSDDCYYVVYNPGQP